MPRRGLVIAAAWAALASAVPSVAQPSAPTVHEVAGTDLSMQAMGYDEANRTFPAHTVWIEGRLLHTYQFRVYAPGNYGTGEGGLSRVPVTALYLPSHDGTFAGVPDGQRPILQESPTAGNTAYSDFVHVHFVAVPSSYEPNSHRSLDALAAAGYEATPTGIVANVPVVPFGSALQDPARKDLPRDDPAAHAPIRAWMAWHNGSDAQTFAFESTSEAFAAFVNERTRDGEAANAGSGYEAAVAPDMGRPGGMSALALWHLNQYATGVTQGQNEGGPWAQGQRNVLSHDRGEDGYSPLRQVQWVSRLPLGYAADDARRGADLRVDNGFAVRGTPIFVNAPAVGPPGGTAVDDEGAEAFGIDDVSGIDHIELEGAVVLEEGVRVTARLHGAALGSTTTNALGGFHFLVGVVDLDAGVNVVTVTTPDGEEVVSYRIRNGDSEPGGPGDRLVWIVVVAAFVVLVWLYGRVKRPPGDAAPPPKDAGGREPASREPKEHFD